jgi:hypothetical protein
LTIVLNSTNRAPLGLHFHASWLKSQKELKKELTKFIDEMLDRNDVYFVTMLQVRLKKFSLLALYIYARQRGSNLSNEVV